MGWWLHWVGLLRGKKGLLPENSHVSFVIHVGLLRLTLALLASRESLGLPQQGKRWKELSIKCLSQPYQGMVKRRNPILRTGNSLHLHSFPNRGHQWPDYNSIRQLDFIILYSPPLSGPLRTRRDWEGEVKKIEPALSSLLISNLCTRPKIGEEMKILIRYDSNVDLDSLKLENEMSLETCGIDNDIKRWERMICGICLEAEVGEKIVSLELSLFNKFVTRNLKVRRCEIPLYFLWDCLSYVV